MTLGQSSMCICGSSEIEHIRDRNLQMSFYDRAAQSLEFPDSRHSVV